MDNRTIRMLCSSEADMDVFRQQTTDVIPNQGSKYLCEVKPHKPSKTDQQRSYLWGWVYVDLARQLEDGGIKCGQYPWTKALLHEVMRVNFLLEYSIQGKENVVNVCKSSEKLPRKEYSEYIDNIHKFAFETWGIHINPPESRAFIEMAEALGVR